MGDILFKVEETVLPNLAKAIMEKTGKTDPLTLPRFAEEIRGIEGEADLSDIITLLGDGEVVEGSGSGGGSLEGLENGWDVMFYDENNEALAFSSVRKGNNIDAPIYVCDGWKTSNEQVIAFPYTPTQDLVLYAFNEDIVQKLYDYYGVSIQEYPYVTLQFCQLYQSTPRCLIAFSKTESPATSDYIFGAYDYYSASALPVSDTEDVPAVVSYFMEKILPSSLKSQYAINFYKEESNQVHNYMYTNYDRTPTQTSTIVYRLDE